MAEHVRMRLELEARGDGRPLNHPGKAGSRERGAALADEDEGRRHALALEPAQRPKLVAEQRMRAGGAIPLKMLAWRRTRRSEISRSSLSLRKFRIPETHTGAT